MRRRIRRLFPDHNPGPGTPEDPAAEANSRPRHLRKDRRAAIAMGKALFWDMQVGSDGIQACGWCHFRAGADPRSINQANPGGADNPDLTVNVGINHRLRAADFPLHQLADPTSRNSRVLRDNDDVISSQGVKLSRFVKAVPAQAGTSRFRFRIRCSTSTASIPGAPSPAILRP